MPEYVIWMANEKRAEVSGDSIERVPAGSDGFKSKDPKYSAYSKDDLLVWRGDRVVAWYKNKEVVGYNEVEMPTIA